MIKIKCHGNYKKANNFLERIKEVVKLGDLNKFGEKGVQALKEYTPKDSGETASSWYYDISRTNNSITITWSNSNIEDGVPIAVILQYGHATRNGGYVQGRDYINPALYPVFNKIAEDAWKEIIEL